MKKPAELAARPVGPSGWLRTYLYATAAVTGGAVMVVEILGAKMLSPFVGTSHFVWTAQIAVTLIALAAGYAAGGWLVDRSPRLTWIYWAILLAALYLCLSVLACERVAYFALKFKLALGSLLAAAALFFVPLALLAMVGPFFVRMLTASVATVGANVGRLTSISTLGSVAGTVLIGYVLIPFLPNSVTMLITAGVLMAVAAAYFLAWERKHAAPMVVLLLVAGGLGLVGALPGGRGDSGQETELFRGNSNFGLLQVRQSRSGDIRYYLNDFLTQNTFDTATRQSASLFTYMLHDLAQAYTADLKRVLCIGVGVGIVPGLFAKEGLEVDAVEINPAVIPVAQKFFDFDPSRLRLHLGDGRAFLNQGDKRYDAIVVDAFLGESPPGHLMTREAFRAMQRRLAPGGVLVMNTFGEFAGGRDFFPASLRKTLQTVFRGVRIHASGNGNVFFVASDQEEPRLVRPPDFAALPTWLRAQAQQALEGVMQTDPKHGLVLTDNYNPVDFYDAANREDLRRRLAMANRRD